MGLALLLFIQTAIGVLRSYVGMYFGTMLNFQMRSNMLRHVMRLPAEFFEKRHVGDVLSRMGSLGPVQDLFTSAFISILLDGIMAVITFGVMYLYSPMLAGCVVGIILLSFIVQFATFPYVLRMNEEQIQKSADLQTYITGNHTRGTGNQNIWPRTRTTRALAKCLCRQYEYWTASTTLWDCVKHGEWYCLWLVGTGYVLSWWYVGDKPRINSWYCSLPFNLTEGNFQGGLAP